MLKEDEGADRRDKKACETVSDYEYEYEYRTATGRGEHFQNVRGTAVGLSTGNRPASVIPRSTGRSEWPNCWTRVMPLAREGGRSCATNLNTHTKGAVTVPRAFPPEQKARAYTKRINYCHTPKRKRQLAKYRRTRVELSDEPMPERPPHWRTCHCCKLRSGSGPTRPTPKNAAWTGNSKSTMPEQN